MSWEEPSLLNGILTSYNYSVSETDAPFIVVASDVTVALSVEVSLSVTPYTNYTVSVFATTGGGNGGSETVVLLSSEAGK